MSNFTESVVEAAALEWLRKLGWATLNGAHIAPDADNAERADYAQVVLAGRLRAALARLNPQLPDEAIEDAFRKLTQLQGATLEARNRAMHRLLVDGVTVEYRAPDGSIRGAQARVLDFDEPDNNDFLAVNQFTVTENKHNRRLDMALFVNGLPLAFIELKNAADENATIWSAFQQLQTYKSELPTLFSFNALLVISDGLEAHWYADRRARMVQALAHDYGRDGSAEDSGRVAGDARRRFRQAAAVRPDRLFHRL